MMQNKSSVQFILHMFLDNINSGIQCFSKIYQFFEFMEVRYVRWIKRACIFGQSGGSTAVINTSTHRCARLRWNPMPLPTFTVRPMASAAFWMTACMISRSEDRTKPPAAAHAVVGAGPCRYKMADPDILLNSSTSPCPLPYTPISSNYSNRASRIPARYV